MELSLRQVRLRFVVRADGVKCIALGQPGEGPQRGVGAAAECLADPQPVIGRASQRTGPGRQGGQPSMSRCQLAAGDLLLGQP